MESSRPVVIFVCPKRGVRFGFDAPKRGERPGEGSPALWGIGRCKVGVERISPCRPYPCGGAVVLVGGGCMGEGAMASAARFS